MVTYQVIARKYRPKTFKEVLGQEPVVQTLKNALRRETMSHAYLFSGSRGTGKTTLARIVAKALNCTCLSEDFEPCNSCTSCIEIAQGSSLDVLEIDGASHRGIDDIKAISESVGYCPAKAKWKIYIIDEVHMLTKEAFNALLKTLEEPPANVKFFFATTELHKVPETIISRCQRFMLQRISIATIVEKLRHIANDNNVHVDDATLFRVGRFAQGGLRDAESLFDQLLAYSEGNITLETANQVLGVLPQEHFLSLDRAVVESDLAYAYRLAELVFAEGKELSHFLEDLTQHYKAILFTKIGCSDLLDEFDASYKEALLISAKNYTQEQCLYILDTILQTQQAIRQAISQQISLEHLLTKIIRAKLRIPVDYLVRRLCELEEKIAPHCASSAAKPSTDCHNEIKDSTVTSQPLSTKAEKSTGSAKATKNPITHTVEKTSEAKKTAAVKVVDTLQETPIESPSPKSEAITTSSQKPVVQKQNIEEKPPRTQQLNSIQELDETSTLLPALQENEELAKKTARQETLMQFAAVELQGTLRKDTRRK